jgi:hypothetical protein
MLSALVDLSATNLYCPPVLNTIAGQHATDQYCAPMLSTLVDLSATNLYCPPVLSTMVDRYLRLPQYIRYIAHPAQCTLFIKGIVC